MYVYMWKIEADEEARLRFLNTILDDIYEIDEKQYEKLSNYLNVIGYELLEKVERYDYYETKHYSLIPSVAGIHQRNSDVSYLRSMLLAHHADLLVLYNEAISNFGSGQYVSCIENCRSMFESFFKKLDTVSNDYVKGILVATSEDIVDNGVHLTSIKKIYTYWINNKKEQIDFAYFKQCIVLCQVWEHTMKM